MRPARQHAPRALGRRADTRGVAPTWSAVAPQGQDRQSTLARRSASTKGYPPPADEVSPPCKQVCPGRRPGALASTRRGEKDSERLRYELRRPGTPPRAQGCPGPRPGASAARRGAPDSGSSQENIAD